MADSRYRITERVASGGMAEVFKGVAESLQGFRKNIAIKRILPALTQNKKFVAMFLDEARLSLALQHGNVVQVFDIGHSEDTYFIVMEYVDGVDLKALIEWRRRLGKRLPVAVTLNIINEICKALAYAHELPNPETGRPLGIVHRDISPPNVLISRQGEVKVADFGLAKATSQLETTEPGVVKGKMSYLSPEGARGEEVDSRADIFSVGILLYELLTGKRLFYGETDFQTVELVRNAKVPPIRAQNPEVERELEDIARKALAQRKEDRFQTAADLQEELAQYSYSRGLKVISRDVADLIRQCLEDRAAESGGKRRGSILDALLQDEINKFTSVDFEDPAARPVGENDLPSGEDARDDGIVDPRGWAVETSSHPVRTSRPTTGAVSLERAPTSSRPPNEDRDREGRERQGQKRGNKKNDNDKKGSPGEAALAPGDLGAPQAAGAPTGGLVGGFPGNVGGRVAGLLHKALAPRPRSREEETPGPQSLASILEPLPTQDPRTQGPKLWLGSRNWKVVGLIAGLAVGAAVTATTIVLRERAIHHAPVRSH